jgi:twitching motility protein PilT
MHERKRCLISQREIGAHSATFADALHSALREDPDVILVGELRDLETMSIAMTAAEMGILVMGTLHTNGAGATIDRVINIFPADKQDHVRNMLSTSLRGVVSQQLCRTADGTGRVAAHCGAGFDAATTARSSEGQARSCPASRASGPRAGHARARRRRARR